MATIYRAIWASAAVPGGISVTWRALNWSEFRQIKARYGHLELSLYSPMAMYYEIYKAVAISGPSADTVSAGIMAQIGLHQYNNNAFSGTLDAVAAKLVEKRNWLGANYLESCRALVAATFRIPFEAMDTWDSDQLFEKFVMAEYALGQQFNPVDPRQVAAEAEQAKRQGHAPRQPQSAREAAYLKARDRRLSVDKQESERFNQQQPSIPIPSGPEEFTWSR
jgi:hypothetical protein